MAPLPLIPHGEIQPGCCGCIFETSGNGNPHYVCNECGQTISREDVDLILSKMDSTEATCPHCGKVNHIEGFSKVHAFVCRFCGEGVALE